MRINAEEGVLFLGDLRLVGGMTPTDFGDLDGFRPNSSVGRESWWWAPDLEGYRWTPFFRKPLFRMEKLFAVQLSLNGVDDAVGKLRNDSVLRSILGEPHQASEIGPKFGPFAPPVSQTWLHIVKNLEWEFDWGTVVSGVEPRDWTPQISLRWK